MTRRGLFAELRERSQRYGAADGIPFGYAQPLLRDDLGNFWIGNSLGLCRWRPGSARAYLRTGLERARGLSEVSAIAAGTEGSLWVGMELSGIGLGLQQLVQGAWKRYVVPGMDGTALEVTALLKDRDNGLWVGTTTRSLSGPRR